MDILNTLKRGLYIIKSVYKKPLYVTKVTPIKRGTFKQVVNNLLKYQYNKTCFLRLYQMLKLKKLETKKAIC